MFYLFLTQKMCLNILSWPLSPSTDVGALQTAVMVDVWQADYSLLSQVMSHSQKSRKEALPQKNHQLTGFSVFIDVSLCFVYQGQGLIRKSEIPGRLCPRALCRLRSKYPYPIMNVVKVVALLKVLCFILEIFLSCRSDLGDGLGGLARSPADNRPYFALIFGATLALFSLFFFLKK